jgi:hypothetical protein
VTHGVSFSSFYNSIWGVLDAINNHPDLEIQFPDHQQQKRIAHVFKKMPEAQFSSVIGAIYGILNSLSKPSKVECKRLNCGEKVFLC